MDVVHTTKKKSLNPKVWLAAAVIALLVVTFWLNSSLSLGSKTVPLNTLMTAQVERGELAVQVFGNGTIVPREIIWVASGVAGRVDRIKVKAGAAVQQGDVLVELDNPELVRQAEEMDWDVAAFKAELAAQKVSMETDILNQQAQIKTVQLQLQSAELQRDAEATLIDQGNGTVSLLDHKKTQLRVTQLSNDLDVEKLRLTGMKRNQQAQLNASEARLNSLLKQQARTQQQVELLTVKADTSGVIQQVPVELGQRLVVGTNLIKMADQEDLIAEIKVAERLVNDVELGQLVAVDTRKNTIKGKVIRIDPAVISGSVQVDVEFTEELPGEARPDLRVNGEILIANLRDTLYVRRPILAQSNQQAIVFQLNTNRSMANKVNVSYGMGSSEFIQVTNGLTEGDSVIISDHTSWEHLNTIRLN